MLTGWPRSVRTGKRAYKAALSERVIYNGSADSADPEVNLMEKYGFDIAGNCYFVFDKNNNPHYISNFVFEPLYSVPDINANKRIFRLRNEYDEEAIAIFESSDFANMGALREKLHNLGTFTWQGKIDELQNVLRHVFRGATVANPVHELGWQEAGFFAFGDGAYTDHFVRANEYGFVDLGEFGVHYLPAMSTLCSRDPKYGFDRNFCYVHRAQVTLEEYLKLFDEVFEDNGRIGLCFLFATLFRVVIVDEFNMFPILDLFGKPQSGKSHLGMALRGFFSPETNPFNIENDTFASMTKALEKVRNGIIHLDEYKDGLEQRKNEMLKAAWDCVGRGKMNNGEIERLDVKQPKRDETCPF